MEVESINIKNYKSLVNFELKSPNAFSVFVGPNAAGKSNIFESLEFLTFCSFMNPIEAFKLFGSMNDLFSKKNIDNPSSFLFDIFFKNESQRPYLLINVAKDDNGNYAPPISLYSHFIFNRLENQSEIDSEPVKQFFNFSRIFIGNSKLVKRNIQDDSKLTFDASNLEKVLKRLLKDQNKKAEIIEWLQLLIPGLDKIEIVNEPLSGSDNLLIYEKGTNKPFNKNLISDGTYNILSILTAVYQSDEPQFLCIEEPENGLNPKVIKELVNLFRQKCNEGHFIWLNTHSQTLVSELTTDEIILVDKVNGETVVKQVKGMNLHGLKMDEALLTNALGGGIPW